MKCIRHQASGISSILNRKQHLPGAWRLAPEAWSGLTLIEIIIVVAILGLLAAMLAGMFSNFRSVQSLQTGSVSVASALQRARAQSIAGVDGVAHGVHFASTTLTLFEGNSYSAGSTNNQVVTLTGSLTVMHLQLATGTTEILFDQLTGATPQWGTVLLQIGSDTTRQKTISVSSQGVVSVQ